MIVLFIKFLSNENRVKFILKTIILHIIQKFIIIHCIVNYVYYIKHNIGTNCPSTVSPVQYFLYIYFVTVNALNNEILDCTFELSYTVKMVFNNTILYY